LQNDKTSVRKGIPFINGLAIGAGAGFLATFSVLWISVFFSSQLSTRINYGQMLSFFIFPLIFLLVVGTVLLTLGIIREYISPV